ncbi:MAG: putative 2-aminoethylphosphonate ABC transporter ATP-binding protein [Gammaproteobacteria bacterium]|nr:MAG: putative 2-aminoethylphosphonate ABC transporter ATP-binding protein [Gammaproteobacteria bacterium]
MGTGDNAAAVSQTPTPYLRIRNVTKMFGAFAALRDISLDVFEGEFVCFLGPSGCGKTTLLRAIAGLDIQTHGSVAQAGRDISGLPPSQRDFGIVFQSYALFPNLTVFKNVAYGLENRRMHKAEVGKRVRELLGLVGLAQEERKYPSQLSGGEQQRVALVRALAPSPGLLLLDEPLSALDARVRVRLRHEIRELQRRLGVTTVMVTHDQEEALTMADRIVVMNQGMIEQVGTPLQIYREPASAFVADFVGTMNFVPAVVDGPNKVRLGQVGFDCAAGLDGVAEGSSVTVAVRPEDIVVRNVETGTANGFDARIVEMEFLGSFYRVSLAAESIGEAEIIADLSINDVRDLSLAKDQTIAVAVPPERIHVFTTS